MGFGEQRGARDEQKQCSNEGKTVEVLIKRKKDRLSGPLLSSRTESPDSKGDFHIMIL